MKINELGQVPATSSRRWTPTAIECYKRGCRCKGCFYKEFFTNKDQKCQMKATVLELVRVFGKPENIKTKGIMKEFTKSIVTGKQIGRAHV